MREIKFRAWNSVTRKMMPWDDIKRFRNLTKLISLNHVIVCQFTGIHDKNGKEIYEGDLIKSTYHGEIFKVIFDEGCYYGDNSNFKHGILRPSELMEGEIIGSIYENPELL